MVTGRQRMHFDQHPNGVISSFLMPDGKTAVTGDSVSNIFMWDTTSERHHPSIGEPGPTGLCRRLERHGGTIAWGNTNRAELPADFPLERTFSLRTLEFGPPPNSGYHRALKTLGPRQLHVADAETARSRRSTVVGMSPPSISCLSRSIASSRLHSSAMTVQRSEQLRRLPGGLQHRPTRV